MDYRAFVDGDKTLLISPAGYGKTHTIAECLKYTTGRQLILTHTHAGVASIKDKIRKSGIAADQYNVETISSFAQKYVNAFYVGSDLPEQENHREYHPFMVDKAAILFKKSSIKRVIKATYSGLFVDEYQDCTKRQHEMILAVSESLKTHILGDPLQGIFDFNGDLVDFNTDLLGFERFPDLSIPHRWRKDGNNDRLGEWLKEIRGLLEKGHAIDLSSDDTLGLHIEIVNSDDLRNSQSDYRRLLNRLIVNSDNNADFDSLLVIVPEYDEVNENGQILRKGDIRDRSRIRAQIDYSKSLTLLEAIDDRGFYSLSKKIDDLIGSIQRARKPIKRIKGDVLDRVFNKSELNKWFNENGIKNKQNGTDRIKAEKLAGIIDLFISNPSPENMSNIIFELRKTFKIKYSRDGLLYSIQKAMRQAAIENISVYAAMKNHRNVIRRSGRRIVGKCIGTTLLTKGLEFDTVVVLDAEKFACPKHLYVALTRCCKNLFIFSQKSNLSPYAS